MLCVNQLHSIVLNSAFPSVLLFLNHVTIGAKSIFLNAKNCLKLTETVTFLFARLQQTPSLSVHIANNKAISIKP